MDDQSDRLTAAPSAALRAGLADRYRIERKAGQGGMATVDLAQDLKHDRKVAVKVLKPELAAVSKWDFLPGRRARPDGSHSFMATGGHHARCESKRRDR